MEKKNFQSFILLVVIAIARVSSGMVIGIFGPTLLSLSGNVGTGVSEVSYIFTALNVGVLIGGLSAGYLGSKVPKLFSYAATQMVMAGSLMGIPFSNDLWLLMVLGLVTGLMFGYLDAGIQAMVLQIWGEEKSRPHIATYHFLIAVGALVTPLIVRPFLKEDGSEDDSCPNTNSSKNLPENTTQMTSTTIPYEQDGVVYAYIICGVYTFVCGILFAVLGVNKTESKVRANEVSHVETRDEEPLKDILLWLGLVSLFYFLSVASESLYTSYVYSISVCSELNLDPSDAALLNTVFWIGYGASRFILIMASNFIKPQSVLSATFLGCILALTVEVIWGETVVWLAWTVAFVYGFFVALMYPAGVSWVAYYTNVSGRYIGVFSIGASLGPMIFLPVAGALFEKDPFNVMYLNLSTILGNTIVYGLMLALVRFKQKILIDKDEKVDEGKDNYGYAVSESDSYKADQKTKM